MNPENSRAPAPAGKIRPVLQQTLSLLSRVVLNRKAVIALVSIFFGLIGGAILMLISGNNPFAGYFYLFQGGLKNLERVGNTLATATPLILTGLSVAFAFRTGLFNIGSAGQMFFGGFCAIALGLTISLPRILMLPLLFIASALGGALWGCIPGYLKAKFNVHEVVSTIMMNWIAFWVVKYLVQFNFRGSFETESRYIPDSASLKTAWLTNLFKGSYINLGLFVAIFIVIIIAVILNKITLGFELKAAGFNKHAAEYAGMKVNRNIVLSMTIAGALSGVAGLTFYTGFTSNMQVTNLIQHGFTGIAVALLGANLPIGVLFTAIFFGILQSGKGFMTAMTEIPPEIGEVIIAIILYFAATSVLIERLIDMILKKRKQQLASEEDER
ncbi:MAG: ABC transporter permease [Spirochaetales bacterium]|nr:ABC transporter permease [Spirochaetales bacterium]